MALSESKLKLLFCLNTDIDGFAEISSFSRTAIVEWILEDRRNTRLRKPLPENNVIEFKGE